VPSRVTRLVALSGQCRIIKKILDRLSNSKVPKYFTSYNRVHTCHAVPGVFMVMSAFKLIMFSMLFE
jgi:hypothetical protein